ncbi:uncharacterized protein [Henckelia pumila]
MKLRDLRDVNHPPPDYDIKSKDFTLSLHYGGKFNIGDQHLYVGGAVIKYDFFEFDMLSLDQFKKVAEHKGVKKPTRAFTDVEHDGFKWIENDTGLIKICEEKIKFTREIHIYLEEERLFCPYLPIQHFQEKCKEKFKDEIGLNLAVEGKSDRLVNDGLTEESQKDGNDDIFTDESSDEDSDFSESSVGDDSEKYDTLFAQNVDDGTEWLRNEFESEEMGKEKSIENNLVDSDDDVTNTNLMVVKADTDNYSVFNPIEIFDPTFELGLLFGTKKELRLAIYSHAIRTKRNLKITKNKKTRLNAKCASQGCGWKLHAVKLHDEYTFQIMVYDPEHSCAPVFCVKNLKSIWLSKKYAKKFRSDPKRKASGFKIDAMEELR